ncbi:ribokinase [Arcticibacter sp.]|jgi:ribokinase|uniref:ribokinase n=1 Tax=Arcticibacter sp. TaxID=1872630 RepID=UPI00389055BE
MSNRIIVVGSMNMDMVVRTDHIPRPGETVLGGNFFMNPGGKGANQAVAVSRLGGDVVFVGKIGSDVFGKQAAQLFDDEGIDTSGLIEDDDNPSGIALITVDASGENSIVVASGANSNLTPADVSSQLDNYKDSKILLMQLETPMETVELAAKKAKENSMRVIVNPAPVNPRISSMFGMIDILTPNVTEAEMLTNLKIDSIADAKIAAEEINRQGVANVIITLGKMGAVLLEAGEFYHIPAPEVKVIDTTAAGDVFNGALAVALAEGKSLIEAVKFACQASAISVTKLGAQSSIPSRNEVLLNILD